MENFEKVWHNVKNFEIICKSCKEKNLKHHTRLYIDWELMKYAIICDTCDVTEVFDESGVPIPKDKQKKKIGDKKVLN